MSIRPVSQSANLLNYQQQLQIQSAVKPDAAAQARQVKVEDAVRVSISNTNRGLTEKKSDSVEEETRKGDSKVEGESSEDRKSGISATEKAGKTTEAEA